MIFIKDKWYKGLENDAYIKFSHIVTGDKFNTVYYSERIENGQYEKMDSDKHLNSWCNTKQEVFALNNPVDINEIQKFLPVGHPDKMKTDKEIFKDARYKAIDIIQDILFEKKHTSIEDFAEECIRTIHNMSL